MFIYTICAHFNISSSDFYICDIIADHYEQNDNLALDFYDSNGNIIATFSAYHCFVKSFVIKENDL